MLHFKNLKVSILIVSWAMGCPGINKKTREGAKETASHTNVGSNQSGIRFNPKDQAIGKGEEADRGINSDPANDDGNDPQASGEAAGSS
jgi:hypothetical protein